MKNLLVINFAMDLSDPLLSHQAIAVDELSPFFNHIYVVTGRKGIFASAQNITVHSCEWKPGKNLRNVFFFLVTTLKILVTERIQVVFSHMTDAQSALIAPITKLIRTPHYLWYAHKHYSHYLKWSSLWVDGIVTSTQGSCPITGKKVATIGQGVDTELFAFADHRLISNMRLLHIGRFDRSKRIHEIIAAVASIRETHSHVTFTQIGSPASVAAQAYARQVEVESKNGVSSGCVEFLPSVPRSQIPSIFSNFDIFIHAYDGSLDKTLIEATLSGLPVVTTNQEYIQIFGTWADSKNASLLAELDVLLQIDSSALGAELSRRRQIAEINHSLSAWVKKLNTILQSN